MNIVKLKHQHILIFLFLAAVFSLAIIKIEDTDTWMHLSFGKFIWSLKGLPATEPFVYTSLERPFSYSSWLFGLLYYLSYSAFNVYGVILLMALTVTTAFFILLKDSLRPYKNHAVAVLVLLVMAMLVRHRFVQRPDTVMMVFLPFSIFSLNAYLYDRKKFIYLLPLTHMLWANMHSSINLMFIPFGAFLAGGLTQHFMIKKGLMMDEAPSLSQLKTIAVVFACSFAASLISPYFLDQYLLGPQYMGTPWFKQEILELMTPKWEITKIPYLLSLAVLFSFVVNFRRFSLIHFMLVVPFVVLSFTAYRFVFLLCIICGPVLARNISSFLTRRAWDKAFHEKSLAALAAVCLIASSIYIIIKGSPLDSGRKAFGFGVNYMYTPEGALDYMDRKGIYGRMLNPFAWGGYINWRDFPKRAVFVDPRGYIPVELLEEMSIALSKPAVLEKLVRTYDIDAIILDYPPPAAAVDADIDILFSNPEWALVYWDDFSLLYLRRGGKYQSVIETDEYRMVKPAKNIMNVRAELHDREFRESLISELKRNADETDSSKSLTFLSFIYNETGLYEDAIRVSEQVIGREVGSHADAHITLGFAYLRIGDLDKSISHYERSLDFEENPTVLFNLGLNYLNKEDKSRALDYLERAVKKNRNLVSAYPLIISIYKDRGDRDGIERMSRKYEEAITDSQAEEHFKKGLEAYYSRRYEIAAAEFKQSIAANPQSPVAYSNLGYVYYDMNMLERSYEYQKKAVEIDPNYANAYYGLALIHCEWGDKKSAVQYWKEYLRIEPTGYFSRRAAEAIDSIEKMP